jgi:hypothetical protein
MIREPVVALVRAAPDTIMADYDRLLRLVLPLSAPDSSTLLVTVLQRPAPFPAESVPPWQLDGVARWLRAQQYRQLTLQLTCADPDDLHAIQPIARDLALEPALPIGHPCDLAVFLSPLRRGPASSYAGATRLAWQFARYRTTLAVIDGTMVGNGPANHANHPEIGNLLIASLDPVAADTIAATLLGLNPLQDVPDLRIAHEQGIGIADLSQIQLRGDTDLATLRWYAHQPPKRQLLGNLPQRIAARLRTFGQHDPVEWTIAERERYTSWLHDTAWGQLFAAYQRRAGVGSTNTRT